MEGAKTVKSKILSLIISIATIFTLTACNTNTTQDDGKLQIVTTLFPQYDFVRAITGENSDITLLLTPGAESHSYEPSATDISKIQQADLFIYNGGESEVWVNKMLESAGDVETLRLLDFITPLENHDDDHEHDSEYDEHIFTSLKNAVIMLDAVNDSICSIDSENASFYNQNTEKYKSELMKLDNDFSEMISTAKHKNIILADRNPFRYFANDYGLEIQAAFTGCSHDTEASPATVSELIGKVQENAIPIVFHIEFSSKKIADKISSATGAKTELLHSCHNISKEDFENNVTYLELMKNNYEVLSEALN
ncbi:MAG: zinc ABC transporter substrate-binding protein [Oscillospiraceae bacterium]|nr:zinc ABC transporter substrate-binding protein [Oscillospiraceae bacterium]